MTAQTALSWFLRLWHRLGGDMTEMIDAMATFIVEVHMEMQRKADAPQKTRR